MYKRISTLLHGAALTTALPLLVACSTDILTDGKADSLVPIGVTTARLNGNITRAGMEVQESQFDQGETLYVHFANGATIPNAQFITTDGLGNTTLAEGSEKPFFEADAVSAKLHAYYPAGVTEQTTAFTVQQDQRADEQFKQSDLMYATVTAAKSGTAVVAPLKFNHLLSKVIVLAIAVDEVKKINSVRIVNGYRKTDVKPLTCEVGTTLSEPLSESQPLAMYDSSEGDSIVFCAAMLPPQSIDGDFLQVDTDDGLYTYRLKRKLQGGRSYTLALRIGATPQTEVEPLSAAEFFIQNIADQVYTGNDITPYVVVTTADGEVLTEGSQYTLVRSNTQAVGKATVIAVGIGSYAGSVASATFNILPAEGTLHFEESAMQVYTDDEPFANPLFFEGDGSVSFDSNDTGIATVDDAGNVTLTGLEGTAIIRATVTGNANYIYDPNPATYTVTVVKHSAEIHYTDAAVHRTYGDGQPVDNTLVNTGDGQVTYRSNDNSVATVDSETGAVTLVKPGAATITATVRDSRNSAYDIHEASFDIVFDKAVPTQLTLSATEGAVQAHYSTSFTINGNTGGTVTVSSADDSIATATLGSDGTTVVVTGHAVGTTTITVSCAESDCYLPVETTFTITVKDKEPINADNNINDWGNGGEIGDGDVRL